MKIAQFFPYLLLAAAGAFSVPTIVSAFTGTPANTVFVTLSSCFLLLAIMCLAYNQKSADGSDLSKT